MNKWIILVGAGLLILLSFLNHSENWLCGGLVLMWIGLSIK